jgi:hypothetical protein
MPLSCNSNLKATYFAGTGYGIIAIIPVICLKTHDIQRGMVK